MSFEPEVVGEVEAAVMRELGCDMRDVVVREDDWRVVGGIEASVCTLFSLFSSIMETHRLEYLQARKMARCVDESQGPQLYHEFDAYADSVTELEQLVRDVLGLEIELTTDGRLLAAPEEVS